MPRGSPGARRFRWTDTSIDQAAAIVRSSRTVDEAIAKIRQVLRHPVTYDAVREILNRSGHGRFCDLLLPVGVEVSPVAPVRAPEPPPTPRPPVMDQRRELPSLDWGDDEETAVRGEERTDPGVETFCAPQDAPTVTPGPTAEALLRDRDERIARNRDKATIEDLVERLREERARSAFLDEVGKHRAPPVIYPREKTSGVREMTAVALASDWHVEEVVAPESVAYRNEYNLDIADARVRKFFRSIIWNIEHHRASGRIAIRDLVLWLGGDLLSGFIHLELIESNQLSPTETMRWLLPRLRDGIYTLLSVLDLESIVIPCSYGNHGRTTEKIRISTGAENSFEWLLYCSLADEFRNEPRIRFEITKSGHQYVTVYDRVIHLTHGDDVRFMGGVGGLTIPLKKAIPMWDLVKKADVHCLGHHHQLLDLGRAVVNGSLIGYGPYSQRIRAEFEPPQQAMFFMDKSRGKCLTTALWVDDENERGGLSGQTSERDNEDACAELG